MGTFCFLLVLDLLKLIDCWLITMVKEQFKSIYFLEGRFSELFNFTFHILDEFLAFFIQTSWPSFLYFLRLAWASTNKWSLNGALLLSSAFWKLVYALSPQPLRAPFRASPSFDEGPRPHPRRGSASLHWTGIFQTGFHAARGGLWALTRPSQALFG